MRYLAIVLSVCFLWGCDAPKKNTSNSYADVKGFFSSEAKRLQKLNPEVKKIVSRNDSLESKIIKNIDWQAELGLFSESDINKPAWKTSYTESNQARTTVYTALDDDLRTRKIILLKSPGGKIVKVQIFNFTENILYKSSERLLYIPDSVYEITKQQKVWLIGQNRYLIKGLF